MRERGRYMRNSLGLRIHFFKVTPTEHTHTMKILAENEQMKTSLQNTSSANQKEEMSASAMEPSGSQMNSTIEITAEVLLPIVNKFIDRLSAVQLTMLAAGTTDSATNVALVDVLVEMVQTLTVFVLRIVLPIYHQDHLREPETYNASLGDSLSESFAAAFHVPQEKSESAQELTALIEREVSQRINSAVSALSAAANSTNLPSEPALYVPGSNISCLRSMVSHFSRCLKGLLLNCQCLGLCLRRPKDVEVTPQRSSGLIEEPASIPSETSVPSLTKAVSDILIKRFSEKVDDSEEVEHELLPLCYDKEAHEAASEIVITAIEDLHYPDIGDNARCGEKRRHFNTGLIHHKVRDFFATRERASNSVRQSKFTKFAGDQFQKMKAELKSAFRCKKSDFVVCFTEDSGPFQPSNEEIEMLPGAVPEAPSPGPSHPLDFGTIKSDVENLWFNTEIKKFTRELTNKMYRHLMAGQTYLIPTLPKGRRLSDSVLSARRWNVDTPRFNFSADILYAMAEDAVGKFCQQMLHWLETEQSDKTSHHDEVSGALTEIDDLITRKLTPTEEDIRPESPEAPSSLNGPVFSETSNRLTAAFSPCQIDDMITRALNGSGFSKDPSLPESPEAPSSLNGSQFSEASNRLTAAFSPCKGAPSSNQAALFEKYNGSGLTVRTSSSARESLTSNIVAALVMRLILKIPREARKTLQTKDTDNIIKRVSEKVQDEVSILISGVRTVKDSIKLVNKAVIEDILREYDSPKQLVKVMLSDPSFDDAVVKALKIHLNCLLNAPPKKSKVARFFSAVGKALAKPFRMCIRSSSDD